MDRRKFVAPGSISIACLLTRNLWVEQVLVTASPDKFFFAVAADTHIIDGFYHGHENSELDTSSLYKTTARLTSARDLINSYVSPDFNPMVGSLGEEQLHCFEAQLQQHRPAFVFLHFPLILDGPSEFGDYGLLPLLRKYRETIQLVISGHIHEWIDFAHTYSPQHYAIAATRYDENAYMLMEVDTRQATWRFLNASLVDWSTHYSKPYHGI
ncbi:MAG: hypothetical protein WCA89_02990 [Terracidiphilus sp.]